MIYVGSTSGRLTDLRALQIIACCVELISARRCTDFELHAGEGVRYVITLDTDTRFPLEPQSA